jgi:uncharacterized protein YkwD
MGKGAYARAVARNTHKQINQERKRRGVGSVESADDLISNAKSYAQRVARAGEINHRLQGESPHERWQAYTDGAENLVQVRRQRSARQTAADAVEKWMRSTPHRDNLLGENFNHDGVGVWIRGRWVYVCHLFGARKRLSSRVKAAVF